MNERTILQNASGTISRRGVFGLLAGAFVIAGFAGTPSVEARRRGGHGRGRGRGRRYGDAHADGLRRGRGGRGRGNRYGGGRKRHGND